MTKTELYIVQYNTSIMEAMQKIENNGKGIAFVCHKNQLKGCITDGDIRRYILSGGSLHKTVEAIAKHDPICIKQANMAQAQAVMEKYYITAVPIVDENQKIVDICFWREEYQSAEKVNEILNVPLVIMAGGKGTRLKPYTDILPKPLIPVGDKTITEHIIDRFAKYGCENVTMIVNYKKDFIKAYFKDSEVKRNITFIEEPEFLGTGGGLKLLEANMKETFFMTNCDILIDANYADILEKHKEAGNMITMVCARKQFTIPYGTIHTDEEDNIIGLQEKPNFEYKINTGFYLIEPAFLSKIPDKTFIHITDVIEQCIKDGEKVGTFLIEEDAFMDMGQMDEFEKMKEKLGV